jgi:hypothetical protein
MREHEAAVEAATAAQNSQQFGSSIEAPTQPPTIGECEPGVVLALLQLGAEKAKDRTEPFWLGVHAWTILLPELFPKISEVLLHKTKVQVGQLVRRLIRDYQGCLTATQIQECLQARTEIRSSRKEGRFKIGRWDVLYSEAEIAAYTNAEILRMGPMDPWQEDPIEYLTNELKTCATKKEQFKCLYTLRLHRNPPACERACMRICWENGVRQEIGTIYHCSPNLLHQLLRDVDGGISLRALSMSPAQAMRLALEAEEARSSTLMIPEMPTQQQDEDDAWDEAWDEYVTETYKDEALAEMQNDEALEEIKEDEPLEEIQQDETLKSVEKKKVLASQASFKKLWGNDWMLLTFKYVSLFWIC